MITYIFYCIIRVHILVSLIKNNWKFLSGGRKDIGGSVQTNRYSGMQIMTAKTTAIRTLYYIHVALNGVSFPQILYEIVPYTRHFLLVKFFPTYYFYKLCIQLPQNITRNRWITLVISTSSVIKWSKIGPSHLLSEHGDPSLLLFVFLNSARQRALRESFKNIPR